jgi:hypothetical protein
MGGKLNWQPRTGWNCAALFPIAALGLLLAGCTTDKLNTSFTTTATGFEFKGVANAAHPLDDPTAEAWRLGYLENYLEGNHLCPTGYTVTQRTPIVVNHTASGDAYDVIYDGHCQ